MIKKIGTVREARPLHRPPGRLRQPLHLRRPRRGRQVLPGAEGRRRRRRRRAAKAIKANDDRDAQADGPASAGRQPDDDELDDASAATPPSRPPQPHGLDPRQGAPVRPPRRARRARDRRPRAAARRQGARRRRLRDLPATTSRARSALDAKDVRLRRLQGRLARHRRHDPRPRRQARGRQGRRTSTSQIRPAGRGAPRIDPKPILDGWKLLEATAIYRASGKNALYGDDGGRLLDRPDPAAAQAAAREARALRRAHRDLRRAAAQDIQLRPDRPPRARHARVPRRVRPAADRHVAQVRPRLLHPSGNVSQHSSGNAVDIAKINGVPILGHQEPGGITEQAVRRLMRLQGTMRPDQIISLLDLGGTTLRDGRPRRPHPRRLPAAVRRQHEARQAGARGAQARPVVRPARPPAQDRQPGRADQARRSTRSRSRSQARLGTPTAASSRRARPTPAFGFVQLEFGFLLGPARRPLPGARPSRTRSPSASSCWRTLGAPERRRLRGRTRHASSTEAEPEPVPTARATVIRAEPFGVAEAGRGLARRAARRRRRAPTAEVDDAPCAMLNRALRAHRAAARDPYARDVSLGPGAGGAGRLRRRRRGGRRPLRRRPGSCRASGAARPSARWRRPEERFAALLGGREQRAGLRGAGAARARRPRRRAARARRRCRRASRSRRCWPSSPRCPATAAGAGGRPRAGRRRGQRGAATASSTDEPSTAVADAVGAMERALRRAPPRRAASSVTRSSPALHGPRRRGLRSVIDSRSSRRPAIRPHGDRSGR